MGVYSYNPRPPPLRILPEPRPTRVIRSSRARPLCGSRLRGTLTLSSAEILHPLASSSTPVRVCPPTRTRIRFGRASTNRVLPPDPRLLTWCADVVGCRRAHWTCSKGRSLIPNHLLAELLPAGTRAERKGGVWGVSPQLAPLLSRRCR